MKEDGLANVAMEDPNLLKKHSWPWPKTTNYRLKCQILSIDNFQLPIARK